MPRARRSTAAAVLGPGPRPRNWCGCLVAGCSTPRRTGTPAVADLLVRHPSAFAVERRYVLDIVLGEWLGLGYAGETHERAEPSSSVRQRGELIVPDVSSPGRTAWLSRVRCPETLPRWGPDLRPRGRRRLAEIPVLFGARSPVMVILNWVTVASCLGLDILGSIFFMLTRYEERVNTLRDGHDRFSGKASLAYREGVLDARSRMSISRSSGASCATCGLRSSDVSVASRYRWSTTSTPFGVVGRAGRGYQERARRPRLAEGVRGSGPPLDGQARAAARRRSASTPTTASTYHVDQRAAWPAEYVLREVGGV